jgi:hypothetical protein
MLTLFLLPLLLSAFSGVATIAPTKPRTTTGGVRSSVVLAKDCFVKQGYFDFRVGSVVVAAENSFEPCVMVLLCYCFFVVYYAYCVLLS